MVQIHARPCGRGEICGGVGLNDPVELLREVEKSIDEALEKGEIEQLVELLKKREELFKSLKMDALTPNDRKFLQDILVKDRERLERIKTKFERTKESLLSITRGKIALEKGYFNINEADRIRKVDRSG